MKKEILILIISLLILLFLLNFVIAADTLDSGLGTLDSEDILGTADKVTSSWNYLSQEWKTLLLENSFVRGIDAFFQKINIIFLILFAQDYSLSLTLFLIILTWGYCFFVLYGALRDFSLFSKGVSLVISFGIVVVMSQMKIIEQPANFIMWLFFSQKTLWMKLIIGLVVFAVIIVIAIFLKKFGATFKANRIKAKEEMDRIKLEQGANAGEALSKAVSES